MWYCDYYTDVNIGSGDGYVFCNENNQCECQVADGGNGKEQCCTAECNDPGCGVCATGCKCTYCMHFASPFYCHYHYETKSRCVLLSLFFYCSLLR